VRRLALLLAALGLAGCPLPQPLPDYPAGTVTPPRILVDPLVTPPATDGGNPVIFVPAGCITTTAPSFTLSAKVNDPITIETIESRWFVNYDARSTRNQIPVQTDPIPPNADTTNLIRDVPAFTFLPYDFAPPPGAFQPTPGLPPFEYPYPSILRVVELVVSNGFDPNPVTTTADLPNRKPLSGFETQVFRWVFLSVPESPSVPCPP
jgi:hypothetical protein